MAIKAADAATVTFGESLEWLEHKNETREGLPEGATQISMWNLFPIKGNPMSEAWNSETGTIPLKTVIDFAHYIVDEHQSSDEVRLTLELLVQTIGLVASHHPDVLNLDEAVVHV